MRGLEEGRPETAVFQGAVQRGGLQIRPCEEVADRHQVSCAGVRVRGAHLGVIRELPAQLYRHRRGEIAAPV